MRNKVDFLYFNNYNIVEDKKIDVKDPNIGYSIADLFKDYVKTNNIDYARFWTGYDSYNMVTVYCTEYDGDVQVCVRMVAVVEKALWDIVGWKDGMQIDIEKVAENDYRFSSDVWSWGSDVEYHIRKVWNIPARRVSTSDNW